jgi:hypothetical protein
MKPAPREVKTFTYEGSDDMIQFDQSSIPSKIPSGFKATLKLKGGEEVKAPREWRQLIWKWWYGTRKDKIEGDMLKQALYKMEEQNGRPRK